MLDIPSFEKNLDSSLDHTPNFCRNLLIFRSKNICQKESLTRSSTACQQRTLTPPDTWSCPTLWLASVLMLILISPELVLFPDFWVSNIPRYFCFFAYKLRRVIDIPNFISSGSKIVKRRRRGQHDPLIIEWTSGLLLGPSTALYRLFRKHCTLTNKVVGTIWRAMSKPPQRNRVLIPVPSYWDSFSLCTLAREQTARSTAYFTWCPCIFLVYYYITIYVGVLHFYDLFALVSCLSSVSIRSIIYKF